MNDNMAVLQNPVCNLCDKTFKKMEYLTTHMTNLHMESDHEGIERLAQTIDSSRKQKIENKDDSIVKEESVYSVKSEEYKIEETGGEKGKGS